VRFRRTPTLFLEIAELGVESGLALGESCGSIAQILDGFGELLERISGGTRIGADPMGFEQRARPECLDELENSGWKNFERRSGVFIELAREGETPALQCGRDDIRASTSHAGADQRDSRISALA